METTTKKIAVACFIGGVLCCAVALAVSPAYWWFGLVAGLAGGYLGYEFREVLAAVPTAWRRSTTGTSDLYKKMRGGVVVIWRFFSEPHPFGHLGLVIAMLIAWSLYNPNADFSILRALQLTFSWGAMSFFSTMFVCSLAKIGAEERKSYFEASEEESARLLANGCTKKPATYWNVYWWIVVGAMTVIMLIPKHIIIFIWHLFKLIHSEKRVLCAIDGTLGGAIAYVWLHAPAISFFEQAALIFFGGLLGAALGVLNWEIVSKRILHVAENTSA